MDESKSREKAEGPDQYPENHDRRQRCSQHTDLTTYNQFAILVIYRLLLDRLSKRPNFSDDNFIGFLATHLVLEEGIPDIFCHFRHGQNVILRFLVSLDADTIVEHGPVIPNRPKSAREELTQLQVGVNPDYLLE